MFKKCEISQASLTEDQVTFPQSPLAYLFLGRSGRLTAELNPVWL
jgi:hypothetical protein